MQLGQIIYYLIAGSIGAAVNIGFYILLLQVFGVWYVVASIIAFLCAVVVSFMLQKYVTFNNWGREKIPVQFGSHVMLAGINVIANTAIVFFLVEQLKSGQISAQVIASLIVAVWSYFIYKSFIFKEQRLPVVILPVGQSHLHDL